MAAMHILALNSGSSSFKFGLHRVDDSGVQTLLAQTLPNTEHADALADVTRVLAQAGLPAPAAIGHRIVHGGPARLQHGLIDAAVLRQIEAATAWAPLHTPAALALIHQARQHFAGLPQVACFDTCFHHSLPDVARVLPIPKALQAQGLQRYGFHGLSLESIVRQLGDDLPPRLVVAHLGNGASITAIQRGRSIDTSMGLTPSGGVIMGTRSGDIDPGVLLCLMRQKNFDTVMLETLIDQQSGLLGISGVSSDIRRLHEAAPSNPDARLAIEMFCYAVRKQIAAMSAVLGGLDLLVFTGGIGENNAHVRAEICAGLAWMGVGPEAFLGLGQVQGQAHGPVPGQVQVQVLASQEDAQIARHAWALLA